MTVTVSYPNTYATRPPSAPIFVIVNEMDLHLFL